jgi:phage terminase large subunit
MKPHRWAELAEKIRLWRKNPSQMVRDLFKAEPDAWQAKVLSWFANPKKRRLAMKACKGPGKTTILAWCILNFMLCYGEPGEHPKGAAVSITKDNLKDNLWPEIAKWHNRSELFKYFFEWTQTRYQSKEHPETWFFSARTWSKDADPQAQANALAGLHAKYLLFVLDESGGIPTAVMATAEAGLANVHVGWAKILQAGNPTHLEGPLYAACTNERHLWEVIEITGDPDDPMRSPRISVEWAKQQIDKYGRDNPWVLVNVFGQFPPGSLNALLGPEEVEAAMKRHYDPVEFMHAQKRLGVDVARFGDDRTVLFPRQGLASFHPVVMRSVRTTTIAARIMVAKERWKWDLCLIDDTGHWGHGVIDNLITAGMDVHPVQFHGPAIDERYRNRRAEMWLRMAEWIRRGGAIPRIPELVGELTTPTYTFVNGKFLLEDKDQIKERLGRSPDLADALALTFALPDDPRNPDLPLGMLIHGHVEHVAEYDPFREGAWT